MTRSLPPGRSTRPSSRSASTRDAGSFSEARPYDRVVGADVLERRDEQRLVEGVVRERQRADVSRRALHPVDVPLREVDADELDTGAEQRGEVRRLRERVADLEHPAGRDEPREHPRDLDHALVGRTREPGATRGARRVRGRRARARRRRRAARTRTASSAVTSSCRNVARESVPSASFSIARSRASASGGRRSDLAKRTLDERRRRTPGGPGSSASTSGSIGLGVVVEAAARLAAETTGGHVPAQQRARGVLRVAEPVVRAPP